MNAYQHNDGAPLPIQELLIERVLIGSALNSKVALNIVLDDTTEEDYYGTLNRDLYRFLSEMRERKIPVDMHSVIAYTKNKDEKVDWELQIAELMECVTIDDNIDGHIVTIKDTATRRRLEEFSKQALQTVRADDPIDKILDKIDHRYTEARFSDTRDKIYTATEAMTSTMSYLYSRFSKDKNVIGFKSGIKEIDDLIGEFQRGDFYIIAGRPSNGKTALSVSIILNMLKQGVKVGFLSIEMSKEQISIRMLSVLSGVYLSKLLLGYASRDSLLQVQQQTSWISETPFFIADKSEVSLGTARATIRKMIIKYGIEIVFIDHLHMMKYDRRNENAEISEITRGLKSTAKEHKIPVVLLAQLSRDKEKKMRATKKKNIDGSANYDYLKPTLQDLRGSGSIEQDADTVIFVHREYLITKDPETEDEMTIIVAKQRNGPVGEGNIKYVKSTTECRNIEVAEEF